MTQAIEYETRWQIETLEDGGSIHQATVLFNPDTGETKAMRSKEEANDYRYFPDPDLLPLEVTEADKARVQATMPELPEVMQKRFLDEFRNEGSFSKYDAEQLTSTLETAKYFESTLDYLVVNLLKHPLETRYASSKYVGNWVVGVLVKKLNDTGSMIRESPISYQQFAKLIFRIVDCTISNSSAKQVFEHLWLKSGEVDDLISSLELKQESDSGAIEAIIDEVLAANLAMVEEFKSGKEKAFNALVGQAMKASKGKANPAQVNEILKKKLTS